MYKPLLSCLLAIFLVGCATAGAMPTPATPARATPNPTALAATSTPTPTLWSARIGTATSVSATPADGPYPAGCTPPEVEAFLARFLDAFNRGDTATLQSFFPSVASGRGVTDYSGQKFVWYSMTDTNLDGSKRHFVAYDFPALWAYFAERHAHHETLRLASLRVSKHDSVTANLTLNLHRTADDLQPDVGTPPGQATGKGVLNCRDRTLLLLSLGQGRDPAASASPAR